MKKRKLFLAGVCMVLVILVAATCIACGKSDTIPVVSLDGECLNDYTNWNDKSTYYPATLTFDDGKKSFTMEIEIKPQGTTSLYAPKKNFTVKFAEGVAFKESWGAQTKYVLKADYIDPTCSGNVVSAKLAAEMNEKYGVLENTPNNGVIDGFPIFVKINGEDAGIFNLTIPKDAWLFNMDESNPNHLVLACEGWSEASRMQSAHIDYEADWSFEVGEPNDANKLAFQRLVTFVSTADDETFVRVFDQYLDLDACLNYICFLNAAYAKDNVAKNMLMVTYDGKVWYPALYDLDSLWGVDAKGAAPMEPDGAWSEELLSDGNCLLYRVNYFFGDQVRERYQELREGILSKEHILESFEEYAAQIPQEYYDINNALWYTDGTQIRTLELMSQLMDEYLPIVDNNIMTAAGAPPAAEQTTPDAAVTAPTQAAPAGTQSAALSDSMVHYVWETDGVQHSLENMDALPVSAVFSYKLDGQAISPQELAGKSGKLEITLRVERKAAAESVYGVAAVVQLDQSQCANLTVTGGIHTKSVEKNADVCMGSAWLSNADNLYEMQLRMDVTDFDPAKYVVVVNPVYFEDGGDDGSLEALLAVASELTAIVNDGITLHTSMTEWHTYLTNVQTTLEATGALAGELVSGEAAGQETADTIMTGLLADAEAAADELLKALGYQVTANTTSEKRVQLLSQAAADSQRTAEEKAQATELREQIENYLVVVNHLQETQLTAQELNSALTNVTATMPDLVGAYSYANDTLYAILYRISTLYQNIASYYASVGDGDGGGDDFLETVEWRDVIIFANHDIVLPEPITQ